MIAKKNQTNLILKKKLSNISQSNTIASIPLDAEDMQDAIECLNQHELSIMKKHRHDPRMLQRLLMNAREDVNETAKALAIDD